MHIVITAGGSGGHVFPGMEVAKELQKLTPKPRVTFVGNKGGFEERMAKNLGLPFFAVGARPLADRSFGKKIVALLFLKLAIIKSLFFLLKHRPQAVIGMGGYVSAPMVLASFFLRIPRFICEQNVVPGQANKLLAKVANKIFLGFEAGASHFPKNKCIYSGNPIRPEFSALPDRRPSENFSILVVGGSQGAQILNQEMPTALTQVIKKCPQLHITHQTGSAQSDSVKERYRQEQIEAHVLDFITDMPGEFAKHDVIVSRAGAMTCAEILAAGKPAIFVPYRFAGGHQKDNALALADQGAGLLVEEGADFATRLAQAISTLYSDIHQRQLMSQKARALAQNDAAKVIIRGVLKHI